MIPLRDANPTRRFPIVTIGLIVLCVVAFGYELGAQATWGDTALERLFDDWALVPSHLAAALAPGHLDRLPHELVTVVTSMFLHGGWIHLIGNMLYLWIFGNNVEDRFGRPGFIAFYLFGGLAAATSQVLIDPASTTPVIGASGAIAAVLGAYLVLYPRARVLAIVFLVFFYQLLEIPAVIVLGFWFILQLIDGLASLGVSHASGGVALFEHIGGFVLGVVIGLLVRGLGGGRSARSVGSVDEFRVG